MIIRELRKTDVLFVELIYDLYWCDDFRNNLSKRLKGFIEEDPSVVGQGFVYIVAIENEEVVGVVAFRKIPEHMKQYAKTDNAAELYIIVTKYRGKGIGTMLRAEAIKEIKKLGYKEILLYSGETHEDSWSFHDQEGFERIADVIAPNGEPGKIWRMLLY